MRIAGVDSNTVLIPGYVWGWARMKFFMYFIIAALEKIHSCPRIFVAMNIHSIKIASLRRCFPLNAIKNLRSSLLTSTTRKLSLRNSFSRFTLSLTARSCPNTSRFIKYRILTVGDEYKDVCEQLPVSFRKSEKAKQKILSIPILHRAWHSNVREEFYFFKEMSFLFGF